MSEEKKKKTPKRKPEFNYLGEYYTKMNYEELIKVNKPDRPATLRRSVHKAEKLVAKDFYAESAAFLDLIYAKMRLYNRHLQNRFFIPFVTKKEALANSRNGDAISKVETGVMFFEMTGKDLKKISTVNEERRIDLISNAKKYAPTIKDLTRFWGNVFKIKEEIKDESQLSIKDAPAVCALISIIAHYQQLSAKKITIKADFVKELLNGNPFHMYNIYAADIPLMGANEITAGCAVTGDLRIPGFLLRGNTIFYVQILIKESVRKPILVTLIECVSFYDNVTVPTTAYGDDAMIHPTQLIPFNSWDMNLMPTNASNPTQCSTIPLHATDIITLVPDTLGLLDFITGVLKEENDFFLHTETTSAKSTNAEEQFSKCRSLMNGKILNPKAYIIPALGPDEINASYRNIMSREN